MTLALSPQRRLGRWLNTTLTAVLLTGLGPRGLTAVAEARSVEGVVVQATQEGDDFPRQGPFCLRPDHDAPAGDEQEGEGWVTSDAGVQACVNVAAVHQVLQPKDKDAVDCQVVLIAWRGRKVGNQYEKTVRARVVGAAVSGAKSARASYVATATLRSTQPGVKPPAIIAACHAIFADFPEVRDHERYPPRYAVVGDGPLKALHAPGKVAQITRKLFGTISVGAGRSPYTFLGGGVGVHVFDSFGVAVGTGVIGPRVTAFGLPLVVETKLEVIPSFYVLGAASSQKGSGSRDVVHTRTTSQVSPLSREQYGLPTCDGVCSNDPAVVNRHASWNILYGHLGAGYQQTYGRARFFAEGGYSRILRGSLTVDSQPGDDQSLGPPRGILGYHGGSGDTVIGTSDAGFYLRVGVELAP